MCSFRRDAKAWEKSSTLKKARTVKASKLEPENAPDELEEVQDEQQDAELFQASQRPSDSDLDFDPEEALKNDPTVMLNEFCADWIESLTRDDQYSLALFLFSVFQQDFQLLITSAAKLIAKYFHNTTRPFKNGELIFVQNEGELPEFLHGKYSCMNVIAHDEELTEKAFVICQRKCFQKGCS